MNPVTSTSTRRRGGSKPQSGKQHSIADTPSFQVKGNDLRRMRGEISCAECRRLKLKCDRNVPCQSCKRRGYESICPNGTMATGDGTRTVMAATEHLHHTLTTMRDRIRQLEDAVGTLHSRKSPGTHPLLVTPLPDDGLDPPDAARTLPLAPVAPEVSGFTGTLSVAENGSSRFLGPGGAFEIFLSEADASAFRAPGFAEEMKGIANLCPWFPFSPPTPTGKVLQHLRSALPPWDRAVLLADLYAANATMITRGLSAEQLKDELLPAVYLRNLPAPAGHFDYASTHALGLMFSVLAIGTLFDSELGPFHAEADGYIDLATAALGLQSVFDRPSFLTVQCLLITYTFYNMRGGDIMDSETAMEAVWSLITMAAQVSEIIGLHRNSERWGLAPSCVERRCVLFWDIFCFDTYASLSTGRPPVLSLAYIDCPFPGDLSRQAAEGDTLRFAHGMLRCVRDVISNVARKMFTATPPSYATVLELDRQVREFPMPVVPLPPAGPVDAWLSIQMYYTSYIRETPLLFMHRRFFTQALLDYPENPLESPYAHSFRSAHDSAHAFLRTAHEHFARQPRLLIYSWSTWLQAFSAAVTLGSLVTSSPKFAWAPAAMTAVDKACELFGTAAQLGGRPAKALPILLKLRGKAHAALANADIPQPGATWVPEQPESRSTANSPFASGPLPSASTSALSSHMTDRSFTETPPSAPHVHHDSDLSQWLHGREASLHLGGAESRDYSPSGLTVPDFSHYHQPPTPFPSAMGSDPLGSQPSYITTSSTGYRPEAAWPSFRWPLTVPTMSAQVEAAWAPHAYAPPLPNLVLPAQPGTGMHDVSLMLPGELYARYGRADIYRGDDDFRQRPVGRLAAEGEWWARNGSVG